MLSLMGSKCHLAKGSYGDYISKESQLKDLTINVIIYNMSKLSRCGANSNNWYFYPISYTLDICKGHLVGGGRASPLFLGQILILEMPR